MFGGMRKKKTSLLTNETGFQSLNVLCDGSHSHAPWGLDGNKEFNTAKEAQYPQGFWDEYCRVLQPLLPQATHQQATSLTEQPAGDDDADRHHLYRPFMQQQGRKIPQLVNEYAAIHTVMLDAVPPVSHKRTIMSPILHIPAGAKLLLTEAKRGNNKVLCFFGIFHSCQQFVQACKSLSHPFDDFMNVPDVLLDCMFDALTMGPVAISKLRLQKLVAWRQSRLTLEAGEKALHDSIPGHLKHLVKDKQFLLLQKLAQGIKWPDSQIHSEMAQGFRLVGRGTQSGVFKPETKHALMTEEGLLMKARFLRPLILGRINSSEPFDYVDELHDTTESEARDKRWLEGPFSAEQVGARSSRRTSCGPLATLRRTR